MLTTTSHRPVDHAEQELAALETIISRARAQQVQVLQELDRAQVCRLDGARTLAEWVTGRLDVAPETGAALAYAARSESRILGDQLEAGTVTFDRVVATMRLVNSGADPETISRSHGVAVHHVRKLTTRQRRMTPTDETDVFGARSTTAQPTLDNTRWRITTDLVGADGEHVFAALEATADRLTSADDPHRPTLPQRRADALVAWAMDALDPPDATGKPAVSRRLAATVFIDAALAAKTGGQAGASTSHGVKVGPNTLAEILCSGTVSVMNIDDTVTGTKLETINTTGSAIAPRVRDYVWKRDQGCTIDGCTSIYRLEPHHVLEQARGGKHHPDNLTLLCWYHHHVTLHGEGFRLDPTSPPGRRRFLRPRRDRATDPPGPAP